MKCKSLTKSENRSYFFLIGEILKYGFTVWINFSEKIMSKFIKKQVISET